MHRVFVLSGFVLLVGLAILAGFHAGRPLTAFPKEPNKNSELTRSDTLENPTRSSSPSPDSPAWVSSPNEVSATATEAATAPFLSGAERVERCLTTTDAAAGAVAVLQQWSTFAADEQVPALSRVLNLLPDDRYEAAQRILLNKATSAEAAEFIFRDAVNRSSAVELPLLLAVMRQPGHPLAVNAHEALVNALGVDHGANQAQWLACIHQELHRQSLVGR